MPCIKFKSGWRIRKSKGGFFPKIYKSLAQYKIRVRQMEIHKQKK